MSKRQQERMNRLMPNGIPKYVRIYDLPEFADQYTIVFSGNYKKNDGYFLVIGMGAMPYHPQGICQHSEYPYPIDAKLGWAPAIGRKCHLGIRINFSDLPKDCQTVVIDDYKELWEL